MLWDREMRKKDDLRVVFFDERAWRAGNFALCGARLFFYFG